MKEVEMERNYVVKDYQELHLEGVYKIQDVYLEAYKYKEGRYVIFPMKVRIGEKLLFVYFNYDGNCPQKAGKIFRSHAIRRIQSIGHCVDSVQLTTDDNQWVLDRVF